MDLQLFTWNKIPTQIYLSSFSMDFTHKEDGAHCISHTPYKTKFHIGLQLLTKQDPSHSTST